MSSDFRVSELSSSSAPAEKKVGVLGASSFVGRRVVGRLSSEGAGVLAFSRNPPLDGSVAWRRLPAQPVGEIQRWVCVAPVWALPEHLSFLQACGARRVVALSSTSRFTKAGSSDAAEQAVAARLAASELRVEEACDRAGVELVILRPTLIYGFGADRNVSDIARFVQRFGCFPVLGKAMGLRQPVHADDVAAACVAALNAPVAGRAYNLSGGETLSYRVMVERVFSALGRRPRIVEVPVAVMRAAVPLARQLPRFRHLTLEMAHRMNRDLVFDHAAATRDLGFAPSPFVLSPDDVSPAVL